VPLAFGFALETHTIVADGHGRRIDVSQGAPYGHDDRSLAAMERVVVAVGDHLRDDNPQCRHFIEIEEERLAVARQCTGSSGATWTSARLRHSDCT
jgi:hypothetical protein